MRTRDGVTDTQRPLTRRRFLMLSAATAGAALLAACGGSTVAPTATAPQAPPTFPAG